MRCGLPSTMGDMKCRNEHTWAAQQAELREVRAIGARNRL
jgi:hypothetical protein